MKGMMVSLLILAMTGTVVGQQQPTSNQRSNDFGPSSDLSQYVAPFELSVSNDLVEGFARSEGKQPLSSLINARHPETDEPLPRKVISEISLFHEFHRGTQDNLKDVYLEPDTSTPGTIRFGLTLEMLQDLESKRFTYKVPLAERGKYNLVEYYLVDSANSGTTPTPDDGSTGSRIQFGPTPATNRSNQFGQQSTRPFVGLPGPVPGDTEFMGPVRPVQDQFATNQDTPAWSPNSTNRNPLFQNPPKKTQWNMPPEESATEKFYREKAELAARQKLIEEMEAEDAARKLAAKRQIDLRDQIARDKFARDQIARDTARKQRETAQTLAPFGRDGNNFTGFGNDLSQQELAQREIDLKNAETAQKLKDAAQFLAEEKAILERKEDEFNKRKLYESYRTDRRMGGQESEIAFDNQRPVYPQKTNRPDRYARAGTELLPTGPIVGSGDGRLANSRVASPDLNAPSPQRKVSTNMVPAGTDNMAMSIPANKGRTNNNANVNKQRTQTSLTEAEYRQKTQGFIYFMLLFSLGLNFYLSWISRGFYVRYHELADELRETFTTT